MAEIPSQPPPEPDGPPPAAGLRVAMDARSLACLAPRGWDRYAIGLVRGLGRAGVEVTLLHRKRRPLHAPNVDGLGCRIVGLADRGGIHWEQVALPRALRRGGFDLYHAPFERGVPLIAPCPSALTIHSVTGYSYADLIRRGLLPGPIGRYLDGAWAPRRLDGVYWRAQVRRADHVLTPSEFSRGEIRQFLGVPGDRVSTTPLAVDESFLSPARPRADRAATRAGMGVARPYLLFVGGFEPHKNAAGLLEMFALIRGSRPDLSLVLVGTEKVPEALTRRAAELGLRAGRDVVFLVDVTDGLIDLYDDAELFVTLSWRESFGLPALEAITRGVPVVAGAWGAAPEVLGRVGRLVDPRDTAAARDAILAELAAGREAGVAARRAQAGRFDWGTTVARTLDVYGRLLAGRRRPGA